MTGHLLIHIGLPKTATTTLQSHYFPLFNDRGCRYLGTLQPRNQVQDEFFLRLRDSVIKEAGDQKGVRRELQELLEMGPNIIVSEELFTVSTLSGSSWKIKLQRLASLVAGLDCTILVTVREPCAGSFSYYVEREPRYRKLGLDYVSAVKFDEAMGIFNYQELLAALDGCFPVGRVRFKLFDDVVAGRLGDIDSILGVNGCSQSASLTPTNSKRIGSTGKVMTGHKETAADLLRESDPGRWLGQELGAGSLFSMYIWLLRKLDTITLPERSVRLPTEAEQAEVAAILLPGWQRLQERMSSNA